MNLIHQTKTWFLDNNILVPDDWVSACVEWIQDEHQGVPQPQDQINSLVYEQWLLADLHELETRCLPSSAVSADKFQMTGAYALQIDSILDIGQSFYSQQQKVKGTINANVGVSAEEEQIKPWEQKPTRMLMFKLTDGTQTVQGMEYRPISCLSPQTQPGSKILIHGSMLCRHGVLMLSESNIKFLGGEVDTLVEANTHLNVLESAMEASTENAGKSHRQEFEGSEIRPSQKPCSKTTGQQFGGSHQNTNQELRQGGQVQGFVKHESKIKQEAPQTQVQLRTSNNFDDQWDDDQMFDALVDDMEIDNIQQPQNNNTNQRGFSNNVNRHMENRPHISGATAGRSSGSITNHNTQIKDVSSTMGVKPETAYSGNHSNVKRNLNLKLAKKEVTPLNSDFANTASGEDDFASLPVKRQRVTTPRNEMIDDFEDDVDFSEINEYEMTDTDKAERNRNVKSSILTVSSSRSVFSSVPVSSTNTLNHKQSNLTLSKPKRDTLKAVKSEPAVSSVKSHIGMTQSKRDEKPKANVGIDRFFSPGKAASTESEAFGTESDAVIEYPFMYLGKVLKQRPPDTKIITVKAYISTLVSKLSSDSGRWILSCKINDGTEACDVDLSDRVLTDLIGFSTEDAMVMKQRAKTDKTMRDIIQKGIQQCQHKLIDLMCLMELDVSSKNPKPVVVALKQISSNDIELLYNRVKGCWNKLPT